MVDDPQRDSASFDSPFGGGGEVPDEDDINALLDGASALAAELAEDLGDPDADALLAQADRGLAQEGDAPDRLDEQLNEMEQLIDDVDADLGSEESLERAEEVDDPLAAVLNAESPDEPVEEKAEGELEAVPVTEQPAKPSTFEEEDEPARGDSDALADGMPKAEVEVPAPEPSPEPAVPEGEQADGQEAEADPFSADVEAALAEAERLAAEVGGDEVPEAEATEPVAAPSPQPMDDSLLDAFLEDEPAAGTAPPVEEEDRGSGLSPAEEAIAEDPVAVADDTLATADDLDFSADDQDLADLPSFDDGSGESDPGDVANQGVPDGGAPDQAGPSSAGNEPVVKKPASKFQKMVNRVALAGGSLGAVALEKADAPFEKLNVRLKRFAGWVALATLATAFVIFIITLF